MRSSEAASPSFRSKKPNLRSSKTQSRKPLELNTKTPEKSLELTGRRTRNRGVALSISDIRKVAQGLQERKNQEPDATSSQPKTVRRQIQLASPRKPKNLADEEEPFKIPEKYEKLGDFFIHLVSSIRLLRLKGSMVTFTNIRPLIQDLSSKRFTYSHLAQFKFIFPEAIILEKISVFDERTSCMKPELHVSINSGATESDGMLQPELTLGKVFRERLRDFCKSNPEVDEIPEETLPEPFNHRNKDNVLDQFKTPSSSLPRVISSSALAAHPPTLSPACMPANKEIASKVLNQKPAIASHMSQSYRPRFSKKSIENGAEKQKLVLCPTISASSDCNMSSGAPPVTPSKSNEPTEDDGSLDPMSPPAKPVSTPSKLMSVTPALAPPKRHFMCPDVDSSGSPSKLVRRPPRSRSLKFDTPKKKNEDGAGDLSIDVDNFDILTDDLLHSIREKEIIAMEERDPAISLAKRRQKMIAKLPKLFNMIHLLVRSINRFVLTKEELMSKIMSGHLDVVDRGEIEEQLNLLLELVPEWISEKVASSGDCLVRINKVVNPETIRSSLQEAK